MGEETQRYSSVRDLKYVSNCIFLRDFIVPQDILAKYDIIVIGEDQTHIKNLDEIPYDKKIIFPRYKGISTSEIIRRIKKS